MFMFLLYYKDFRGALALKSNCAYYQERNDSFNKNGNVMSGISQQKQVMIQYFNTLNHKQAMVNTMVDQEWAREKEILLRALKDKFSAKKEDYLQQMNNEKLEKLYELMVAMKGKIEALQKMKKADSDIPLMEIGKEFSQIKNYLIACKTPADILCRIKTRALYEELKELTYTIWEDNKKRWQRRYARKYLACRPPAVFLKNITHNRVGSWCEL